MVNPKARESNKGAEKDEQPRYEVGKPFNPARKFCGFYPPDIVGKQRDLTDGARRLYERGVRWAGNHGCFWYSYDRMAEELGKCSREIKRDVAVLETKGFLSHERRRRLSNLYRFLWHSIFEGVDGTGLSLQSGVLGVTDPVKSGVLGVTTSRLQEFSNKEELCNLEPASALQSAFPSQKGFSSSTQKRITPDERQKAPLRPEAPVRANDATPKKTTREGKADSKADAPAKTAGEEKSACAEEPWTDWNIGQLKLQLRMFMEGDEGPDNVVSSILHLAAQYRKSPDEVFAALDAAWDRRAAPGKKNAPRKWNWFFDVLRNAFDPNHAARPRECPAAPWAEDRVSIGSEPFNVSDDDLGVPF